MAKHEERERKEHEREHERKEHERERHRGGRMHKARGGKVMEHEPGKEFEDERTEGMVHEEEEGKKHGGKVKGHHPKHRMDRRARGGRMTPKEPFSGADGPNPAYARSHPPKGGTEGKGKEVHPS
jgi:hypothetical protein